MAKKKPKTKPQRRDNDDDKDDVDAPPKTKSDAYVGLLVISLLALLVGNVLMFLDHDELSKGNAPAPAFVTSEDGLNPPKAAPKG